MATYESKIDGNDLFKLFQNTALHHEIMLNKGKLREYFVAHIDERRDVLDAIRPMRLKLEGELMKELLAARADPQKLDALVASKTYPYPSSAALLKKRFLLAPPSAIRELASRFTDAIIDESYLEALAILGR